MLRKAFHSGITFTVGYSFTRDIDNVVTWNDIHHKTNYSGPFGYPDNGYLDRLIGDLEARYVYVDEDSEAPSETLNEELGRIL